MTRPYKQGEALVIACADGAGSASHSDVGSMIACDGLTQQVSQLLESEAELTSVTRETVTAWLQQIRLEIADQAAMLNVSTRQLATTLLGGVITSDAALFLQIGDGAIVARRQDQFECVFWPQSGEYANTTNFITDTGFADAFEYCIIEEPVDECVLFSDGLERLVLNFSDRQVHRPFIEPMLNALRSADPNHDFFTPLREFLNSEKINARTDDDKTLILATRLEHADRIH